MESFSAIASAKPLTAAEEIRRSWRVLLAAMIGLGLSGGASLYWFGVMVGPLARHFGWSIAAISGWALLVHVTTYALSPFSGALIDRLGARRTALWSIPLVSIGFVGVGLGLNALWMLYLGAFVVGLSNSFLATFTRTINTWFDAGRGIAIGIAYSGAGLTSIVGPRLTVAVIDAFGWRAGFVFMGGLTMLAFPAVWFWLQERRFATGRAASAPETGCGVAEALRLPMFWLIGGGCVLYFLSYNGIQFGLIPLLTSRGLSRASAADYAGLMGVFILIGKLASGLAFDRARMPWVLAAFLVADAAAFAGLGFGGQAAAAGALALVGFAQGAMMNGFPYSVARYFGVRCFAAISGMISLLLSLSAAGALVFSRLHDALGSYVPSLLVAAALLVGAAALFALLGLHPYFGEARRPTRSQR